MSIITRFSTYIKYVAENGSNFRLLAENRLEKRTRSPQKAAHRIMLGTHIFSECAAYHRAHEPLTARESAYHLCHAFYGTDFLQVRIVEILHTVRTEVQIAFELVGVEIILPVKIARSVPLRLYHGVKRLEAHFAVHYLINFGCAYATALTAADVIYVSPEALVICIIRPQKSSPHSGYEMRGAVILFVLFTILVRGKSRILFEHLGEMPVGGKTEISGYRGG